MSPLGLNGLRTLTTTSLLLLLLSVQAYTGHTQTKMITETVVLSTATVSCCGAPPDDMQMVWPELTGIEPHVLSPGEQCKITGTGGYRVWQDEAGTGLDESARSFDLFLGESKIGEIQCYVNRCESILILPEEISPGFHAIAVEGGSEITLEVKSDEGD